MSEKPHKSGGSGHGDAPIIIKKKRAGHAGHHGGAWKVAYADFVTAMMAFFLVMWLVNQKEEVRQAIGGYFRDPVGFEARAGALSASGNDGVMATSRSPFDTAGSSSELAAIEGMPHRPPPAPEEAREALRRAAEDLRRAFEQMPDFREIQELVQMTLTEEGLLIELMESDAGTFFERGSKRLSPAGGEVLREIARVIAPMQQGVVLEGHTDAVPYARARQDGYSNWELSVDRANAARALLEGAGVEGARVKAVRGYAAQRPRFPDDPADARNRRIAILVLAASEGSGNG